MRHRVRLLALVAVPLFSSAPATTAAQPAEAAETVAARETPTATTDAPDYLSAAAASNTIAFTNAQHLFRLNLPAGWQIMDTNLAASFIDPEKSGKGTNIQSFGYQLVSSNAPPATPYITVHVARAVQMTAGGVRALENDNVRMNVALLRLHKEAVPMSDIIDCTYDPLEPALRTDYRWTHPKAGRLRAIDYLVFTRRGDITMSCVAPDAEFERTESAFEQALASFKLHSDLISQPGSDFAVLQTTNLKIRGIVLLFFFGLGVVWRIVQYRSGQIMSDEI